MSNVFCTFTQNGVVISNKTKELIYIAVYSDTERKNLAAFGPVEKNASGMFYARNINRVACWLHIDKCHISGQILEKSPDKVFDNFTIFGNLL